MSAVLAALLLAGSPGLVYAVRTWALVTKVDTLQDKQEDIRVRLSILETQNSQLVEQVQELRAELADQNRAVRPPG